MRFTGFRAAAISACAALLFGAASALVAPPASAQVFMDRVALPDYDSPVQAISDCNRLGVTDLHQIGVVMTANSASRTYLAPPSNVALSSARDVVQWAIKQPRNQGAYVCVPYARQKPYYFANYASPSDQQAQFKLATGSTAYNTPPPVVAVAPTSLIEYPDQQTAAKQCGLLSSGTRVAWIPHTAAGGKYYLLPGEYNYGNAQSPIPLVSQAWACEKFVTVPSSGYVDYIAYENSIGANAQKQCAQNPGLCATPAPVAPAPSSQAPVSGNAFTCGSWRPSTMSVDSAGTNAVAVLYDIPTPRLPGTLDPQNPQWECSFQLPSLGNLQNGGSSMTIVLSDGRRGTFPLAKIHALSFRNHAENVRNANDVEAVLADFIRTYNAQSPQKIGYVGGIAMPAPTPAPVVAPRREGPQVRPATHCAPANTSAQCVTTIAGGGAMLKVIDDDAGHTWFVPASQVSVSNGTISFNDAPYARHTVSRGTLLFTSDRNGYYFRIPAMGVAPQTIATGHLGPVSKIVANGSSYYIESQYVHPVSVNGAISKTVFAIQTPYGSTSFVNVAGTANVIAAGGANVIAAGGANVIAAGGANVIAAGGANVIAAGGANVIPGLASAGVIAAGGAN